MSPHVKGYLSRLDRRLHGLNRDQRHALLRNELDKWLYRYERFVNKVDFEIETSEDITAWDYLDTILAINAQLPGCR